MARLSCLDTQVKTPSSSVEPYDVMAADMCTPGHSVASLGARIPTAISRERCLAPLSAHTRPSFARKRAGPMPGCVTHQWAVSLGLEAHSPYVFVHLAELGGAFRAPSAWLIVGFGTTSNLGHFTVMLRTLDPAERCLMEKPDPVHAVA